jgi:hypothetical protein
MALPRRSGLAWLVRVPRERRDVRSLSPTKRLGTWPTLAEAKLKCELHRQRLRRWPGRKPAPFDLERFFGDRANLPFPSTFRPLRGSQIDSGHWLDTDTGVNFYLSDLLAIFPLCRACILSLVEKSENEEICDGNAVHLSLSL